MSALTTVANAQLVLLAHTMRITQLVVPGCSKEVSLRGTFVTAKCNPREGASVILNSERRNGFATLEGIKQYADRWLHGVPSEFYSDETNWWFLGRVYIRATRPFYEHLDRFARTLEQANCVIKPQLPLVARGLYRAGSADSRRESFGARSIRKLRANTDSGFSRLNRKMGSFTSSRTRRRSRSGSV